MLKVSRIFETLHTLKRWAALLQFLCRGENLLLVSCGQSVISAAPQPCRLLGNKASWYATGLWDLDPDQRERQSVYIRPGSAVL